MHTVTIRRRFLAASLALFFTVPAIGQDSGDWLFRVGVGYISTDTSDDVLVFEGIPLEDFRADVDDGISAVFNLTYFLSPNWGLELLASTPFNHDIDGRGALEPLGKLGEAKHLPPTLSLQYHFRPNQDVRPYLGAGLNWTLFFDDSVRDTTHEGIVATANGALGTDFSGGRSTLSVDDSFGIAFQAGVDFKVTERWFANLDLRYIDITADAEIRTETFDGAGAPVELNSNFDLDIDPWVFSLTFGFMF